MEQVPTVRSLSPSRSTQWRQRPRIASAHLPLPFTIQIYETQRESRVSHTPRALYIIENPHAFPSPSIRSRALFAFISKLVVSTLRDSSLPPIRSRAKLLRPNLRRYASKSCNLLRLSEPEDYLSWLVPSRPQGSPLEARLLGSSWPRRQRGNPPLPPEV